MTIWLAKRTGNASRWWNYHFWNYGAVLSHFIAWRTRKEAKQFCDEQKTNHGTDWEVVKFTPVNNKEQK